MRGVMKPVPAGLPSQPSFLTPPPSSFASAAAPADGAAAASPKPEKSVAKRVANALRVKRLENICVSPLSSILSNETVRQCKTKNVGPNGHGYTSFAEDRAAPARCFESMGGW